MRFPLDFDFRDVVDVVVQEGSDCELGTVDLLPFVEIELVDVSLEEELLVFLVWVAFQWLTTKGIVVSLPVLLLLHFLLLLSQSFQSLFLFDLLYPLLVESLLL